MNKNWNLYADTNKYSKLIIPDFIKKLKKTKQKIKIIRFFKLLMRLGPGLHRPYADLLKNGVYELRIRINGNHLRILYSFIKAENILLTQAFFKSQNKIPQITIQHTINQISTIHKQIENKTALPEYFINIHQFIAELFNDNGFCINYEKHCNICEHTVKLVCRIYKLGFSLDDIARKLKLDKNSLYLLEKGERCQPEVMVKLLKFFNEPMPDNCKKLGPQGLEPWTT